jgi:hypothetical protein
LKLHGSVFVQYCTGEKVKEQTHVHSMLKEQQGRSDGSSDFSWAVGWIVVAPLF